MAVFGALTAFNLWEEDWSEYSEKLIFYFTTNRITTDANKNAVLLWADNIQTFAKFWENLANSVSKNL